MIKLKSIGVAIFAMTTLLVSLSAMPATLARSFADTAARGHSGDIADIGGCPLFPANSIFNARVDSLPVHPSSASFVSSIGTNTSLHPDFGTTYQNAPIGIPYITVPDAQAQANITFRYGNESDPGPYPIPADAPIEGGPSSTGDRHILMVQTPNCKLYEVFAAYPPNTRNNAWCVSNAWCADSGAVWDLRSNALRTDTWTSADAAGLPILPLLVRYDEATAGEIRHAIRFTADLTRDAYVWPARHSASDNTSASVPPLGMRFRLKASVNVEALNISPETKVIFRALKAYGMFLADNGSNWYISGAHDPRWNDEELVDAFRLLKGSDFEAVDSSSLMVNMNSGEAKAISLTPAPMLSPTPSRTPSRTPSSTPSAPAPSPTPTPTFPPFTPSHWTHLPLVRR